MHGKKSPKNGNTGTFMKKILIILFSSALVLLFVWLLVKRPELSMREESRRAPRTIVPVGVEGTDHSASGMFESAVFDESRPQPLIMLENNEIFLNALSIDLTRDGIMDQVCAIRKTGSPNIYIAAGIQNPITGEYSRLPDIQSGITQARTLLLYSTDLLGDRSNPVIVSGMTSENNHALAVYLPDTDLRGTTSLVTIADLQSDGPITIKEIARSDAYNRGVTSGESYPIHTYNSDPQSPETLNQIERIYRWNRRKKHYEQVAESKIAGKRLESRLVSQLQGATLETFEDFLAGLWYMPAPTARQGARYLFFDTQTREITFHSSSVQEVFIRDSGAPRRYGAYLTTRNKSISSIRRMMDIELTGIDEIKIKVLEDVKLKIGVASDWDGIYRKMGSSGSGSDSEATAITRYREILTNQEKPWTSSDGQSIVFSGQTYRFTTRGGSESGHYALMWIRDQMILQLRRDPEDSNSAFFSVAIQNEDAPPAERKIVLTEVRVSMEGIRSTGANPMEFTPDN